MGEPKTNPSPLPQGLALLTPEQITTIVRDAVRAELAAGTADPATTWLSAEECAKVLGVARSSLPVYVSRDGLPAHRVGNKYRFNRAEVERWLEQRLDQRGAHTSKHAARLKAVRGGAKR